MNRVPRIPRLRVRPPGAGESYCDLAWTGASARDCTRSDLTGISSNTLAREMFWIARGDYGENQEHSDDEAKYGCTRPQTRPVLAGDDHVSQTRCPAGSATVANIDLRIASAQVDRRLYGFSEFTGSFDHMGPNLWYD